MGRFDLFEAYRFVLAVFISIYTVLGLARLVRRYLLWPATDRPSRLLARYAVLLLLRLPARPMAGEILQTAALLALLALLIRLHA